jgi:hypothetical protein
LRTVIVSVDACDSPTLAGENASLTTGGAGVTDRGDGHAPAPALAGALLVAAPPATLTVALSTAPSESVTVREMVPEPLLGWTVTFAAAAPDVMLTPPAALQA